MFWRMSKAGVFHEFGKYVICLVLLVGLLRQGRTRLPAAPMAYFCLLLPGALMTLLSFEWYTSRRLVSQNLSGPFALLACATYCRYIVLRRSHLITMMIALVLPLIAVAMYAARSIATYDAEWGLESNTVGSGGSAANQVSAMLGMGAFAALAVIVLSRPLWLRLCSGGLLLWFLGQAALTFSRTGVYLVLLSSVALGAFLLRERNTRMKFLAAAVVGGLMGVFVVYPMLQNVTAGKLSERFSQTDLSNRSEIAAADIEIWRDHLLFGVGVGQANFARGTFGLERVNAHTEYTRLLAEHGLLGTAALCILFVFIGISFLRQQRTGRAFAVGFLIWALAFMAVSAMRLAAPSFLIGLSLAGLALDPARKRMGPRVWRVGFRTLESGLSARRGWRKHVPGGFIQ
jgi:O-antigen ligase